MEEYGKAKKDWLKTFLQLPGGIPSHDTFHRVFAAWDAEELAKGFAAWVSSLARLTAGEAVAIDGKALSAGGSQDRKPWRIWLRPGPAPTIWCWGQGKADDKSNEITAIPKLLEALKLSGTVVTIDAMGWEKAIAEKIVDKKADHILAVKDNQGHLLEEIKDSFRMLPGDAAALVAEQCTTFRFAERISKRRIRPSSIRKIWPTVLSCRMLPARSCTT